MKIKVMLFGRYANRTPMAYQAYVPLFTKHLDYVYDPGKADILISGSVRDFDAHHEFIAKLQARKPALKLVVVSEEPFWDTIWGERFYERCSTSVQGLTYYNINHATSGVFQFDKIPYFLTTDDKFVQRYAFAFERNSQYSPSELLEHFQSAELTFAAMAEKRTAQRYDVVVRVQNDSEKGYDIQGLCRYRSLATQAVLDRLPDSRLDIRGGGWRKQQQKRQTLDDWHLDKLITFDKRAKFSSALENTDQPFYVTEKLFDAYAMLSVPVVHQSTTQALEQLACSHSLINVAGKKPEDLPNILQSFRLDSDFANEYGGTMQNLAGLFSHPKVLANERSAIVSRLLSELSCL